MLISDNFHRENSSFYGRSEDMCALRESLGDIGRIGILYCAPLSKKKKEKRSQHYLRCGNSLLNHGNITMFNRA